VLETTQLKYWRADAVFLSWEQ